MNQLTFATTRFGEIAFEEADVISFAEPILGFPSSRSFVVIQHKEGSPFRWLQSLDEPSLAFLVVDPVHFVPEYSPEMPASAARSLGIDSETAYLVYTIVTIPPGRVEDMSVNLAGPIVVNCDRNVGKQIVLEDDSYHVRHRVFDKDGAKGEAA